MDEYRSPIKGESPKWRPAERRSFEKSLAGYVASQFYRVETLDGGDPKNLVDFTFPSDKVGIMTYAIAIVGRWTSGSAGDETDYSEIYVQVMIKRNKSGTVETILTPFTETNNSEGFSGLVNIDLPNTIQVETADMDFMWDVYVNKTFALVNEQLQIFP